MSTPSYNHASSEMLEPFEYDNFISVTSSGGNIGRLFWDNQCQFTIETWERGGDPWATLEPPTTSRTSEIPGSFALIATIGDWWAWSFLDFSTFRFLP